MAWGGFGLAPVGAPLWHAHALVFGQALAVLGGYLLTRVAPLALLGIASLWLAARGAALLPAGPALGAALSVAATAAIALPAARVFLRGAKRAGNLVFPVLVGSFLPADALFQLGLLAGWPAAMEAGLRLGLGLVVLMMAAMGGRLLGAAASGAAQRRGGARIAPRPGLEGALLGLLAAGMLAAALGAPLAAAPPLGAAGVLMLARLLLWAPGLRQAGGDVLALAAGQAWLGLGLAAWAATLPLGGGAPAALHLAAIGGIGGTLLVMVLRSAAQREGGPMPRRAALVVAGLMGGAAMARALAPPHWGWPLAALLWTAASLLALAGLLSRGR